MCDCEDLGPKISSLVDALKPGHGDDGYEGSEPMSLGGPAGNYKLRSPFVGSSQFKIDSFATGNAVGTAVIGRNFIQSVPGMASTDTATGELSPIQGIVVVGTANQTQPYSSEWYDITDSNNVIFAVISTTAAMYITVKFRQKRK